MSFISGFVGGIVAVLCVIFGMVAFGIWLSRQPPPTDQSDGFVRYGEFDEEEDE
jgi:hypothetical protein